MLIDGQLGREYIGGYLVRVGDDGHSLHLEVPIVRRSAGVAPILVKVTVMS